MRCMFFKKGGHQNHRRNEIRNNAREVARLLQQLRRRKGKESCDLLSCIDHANYRDVIDAVRQVAGFSDESQVYQTPELARKMGLHVKSCALIANGIALENNDMILMQRTENFLKLHDLNFFTEIGAQARRVQNANKRNKQKLIPLREDVSTLTKFLKKTIVDNTNILEDTSAERAQKMQHGSCCRRPPSPKSWSSIEEEKGKYRE
ncbi:hypothetical protein JTE90_022438 [Oedothorax gibbosus]|uniref:Uncharacterized protein n=1 Tax=Oedothorax gibbosus TaxID=931172 RepID=A0AAV6TSI9_9ARAC|nr:hypothetical protein JTE90_022438 [Oedothorax gibbosus]